MQSQRADLANDLAGRDLRTSGEEVRVHSAKARAPEHTAEVRSGTKYIFKFHSPQSLLNLIFTGHRTAIMARQSLQGA